MTEKNWKDHIRFIVETDDYDSIDLLARMLYESEDAKNELRKLGYGWTGLSLLDTVRLLVLKAGHKHE